MSVISIAQCVMFKQATPGYLAGDAQTINRVISSISLGALPQSYPECLQIPIKLNRLRLGCDENTRIAKVIDMGFVPRHSAKCLIDNSTRVHAGEDHHCDSQILLAERQKIERACIGERHCYYHTLKNILDPKGTCAKNGKWEKFQREDYNIFV